MDDFARLTEALATVRGANNQLGVWTSVKDLAAGFGYSHLVAVDFARLVGGARGAMLYSDAPDVLVNVDREMSFDTHPLVMRALQSPVPFLVSELRRSNEGRWSELLTDVVRQGDGLCIPVYRGAEPIAGLNFGGLKGDASTLVRAMLQVISHAAVERAIALRDGQPRTAGALSAREAQCLRHVAIGRPDVEIGQMLGISPRTVRFHVDSAKQKLGVSTRIQAVSKALREKIISV